MYHKSEYRKIIVLRKVEYRRNNEIVCMKKICNAGSFLLFISLVSILVTSCPAPVGIDGTYIPSYSITVDNVNSADGGEYVSSDIDSAVAGETVTLTAHLNSNRVVTLAVPGVTISPSLISTDGGTTTFTMPAKAANITATFSDAGAVTTYTVTYNGNNSDSGTVPTEQSKTTGGSVTIAGNTGSLVKAGYSFSGWNTSSSGAGTDYAVGSTYSSDANLTLYSKWTAKTYIVTFDAQSGTTPNPETKTVTYDSAYGTLATTSRTDNDFAGWWTGSGGTGSEVTAATVVATASDHTLYAKWTESAVSTYNITYSSNGADDGTVPADQTKTAGEDLTLQINSGNLAKTGYTFAGWNTLANGTGTDYAVGATYSDDADLDLYAKWTAKTYTVTFDADGGGTPSPEWKTVTFGSSYGTLASSSWTDHTFEGWFTDTGGAGTEITAGTTVSTAANHTLYAFWTENAVTTYTVTYSANGADGGSVPDSQTKDSGIDLTLADNSNGLTRTGYTFAGWNTLANGNGTDYAENATYSSDADLDLYAKWTANTYTITFDAQEGDSPAPATISVTYDSAYGTLATTNRTGYDFAGWWTEAGGTGSEITATDTVSITADQTLYANWALQTFTITYDSNGADDGSIPDSQTKSYGNDLTLADNSNGLTRTGYTFAGWNTLADGNGTDYAVGVTYSSDADLGLYAKWTANTYTITFDAQEGDSPSPATISVTYDSAYGTLATTNRTGYDFAGWWTEAGGTGSEITATDTVSITADQTLYANWALQTFTITYDSNGADDGSIPDSQTKSYGIDLTLADNSNGLTRTGYTFAGWNTLADGNGTDYAVGVTYSSDADLGLYAKWTANSYTVSFDADGGSAVDAVTVTYGDAYGTLPSSELSGYTFAGWWTEPSGGGTQITESSTVSEAGNHTLYAKWN